MKPEKKLIITLLTELLEVTKAMAKQTSQAPAAPEAATTYPSRENYSNASKYGTGITKRSAKFESYQCVQWDPKIRIAVNLGSYLTVEDAKQTQQDYLAGRPITKDTKAVKLHLVPKAA